jgi:hypothetical protein
MIYCNILLHTYWHCVESGIYVHVRVCTLIYVILGDETGQR